MPLHSKKAIFCFVAFFVFSQLKIHAQSNNHRTETWSVDYTVDRVEHSGGYTMASGSFGPYSGSGALYDLAAEEIEPTFPKISGSISASVPDGNGGWFIGGSFSYIDDVAIKNLAHIKSDKTLDVNWKPNPAGLIYAMAISGNTLYIGGTFQSVASQTRNFLAAIDATNGSLKSWNPNGNH